MSGAVREQAMLLPPRVEDFVAADAAVRVIAAFAAMLDPCKLGFERHLHADPAANISRRAFTQSGRPAIHAPRGDTASRGCP